MSSLNFPQSPTNGQTYTSNGSTWVWDGISWNSVSSGGGGGGSSNVVITANGGSSLNTGNINFINTASVNVAVTSDPNGNANVAFTVDLSSIDQLIFTQTTNGANVIETLTGFQNTDGTISTVRTVAINAGVLTLNLATFTPSVTATVSPSSPYWDQGVTSFTAYATNPSDVTNQYLSNVYSITQKTGNVTGTINSFTAGSFNVSPSGGVSWQRTYSTNGSTGFIGSTTATVSGGSASANLSYNVHTTSGTDSLYTAANSTFTVNWQSAAPTITITALASNTFLNTYSTTTYSVGSTGVANTGNVVHTITPTGGTVSNASGAGTLTFTNLVSVANGVSGGISLSTQAQFSRPANVTGTFYQANATTSASLSAPTWTYPSFTLFTTSTATYPVRANVISGNSFSGSGDTLTILGNSAKNFTGNVVTSGGSPKAWWLGVSSNATQPSSFAAGTPSLQSSVTPVTTTVTLYPDANSSLSQAYTLYGFTVQPGNTYFIIS
jgi:hypothetical protein